MKILIDPFFILLDCFVPLHLIYSNRLSCEVIVNRLGFFSLLLLLFSCNSTSDAVSRSGTARLTLFYSNDLQGYLEPCG